MARVLVDRLWPRGLRKSDVAAVEWLRDLAPSNELRKWFHARPAIWQLFRKRYLKELARPEAEKDLLTLYRLAHKRKRVTLLFASKNETHNMRPFSKICSTACANLPPVPVLARFDRRACATRRFDAFRRCYWRGTFRLESPNEDRLSMEPGEARARIGRAHADHGHPQRDPRFFFRRRRLCGRWRPPSHARSSYSMKAPTSLTLAENRPVRARASRPHFGHKKIKTRY